MRSGATGMLMLLESGLLLVGQDAGEDNRETGLAREVRAWTPAGSRPPTACKNRESMQNTIDALLLMDRKRNHAT
eukprot:m.574805 g.574805  ORF g.574805 m.574805 type:complete len:75 (+) comp57885_c0_seq8:142-366(+)